MNRDQSLVEDVRILVVEDSPTSLAHITYELSQAGFEVHGAACGAEALAEAARLAPDAILLDVELPDLDGYEVCRRLKQNPGLADVPVLFLSAYQSSESKVLGLRVGGVDFITKPHQVEEVHARLMTHVKLMRLQRQLAWQNANLKEIAESRARELAEAEVSLRWERERRAQSEKESRERLAVVAHLNRITSATAYCSALVHELNQPLAAILCNAEAGGLLLAQEQPRLDELRCVLEDIRSDDLRASELIARMRELLRRTDGARQRVDLNEVLANTQRLLASTARTRHVDLLVQAAPEPLPVSADRLQLQQVLINLVINAIDASPADADERPQVRVCAAHDGNGCAEVEVRDQGPGFAVLERAFERYFTTKPNGMGLGLSIAATIVRGLGGRIEAANGSGGGAVMRFWLPLEGDAP